MRTGRDFRRKPVDRCAICGSRVSGASPGDVCPNCGEPMEATRLYRENFEGYAVEKAPPHKWKSPEAHRVA